MGVKGTVLWVETQTKVENRIAYFTMIIGVCSQFSLAYKVFKSVSKAARQHDALPGLMLCCAALQSVSLALFYS